MEKKPRKLGGLKKNVKLVYAEVNPLDSIVGKTGLYFKEQVAKLSDGTVTIDIQASGVLGSENDVLDSILGGGTSIDMSRISAFALTSYGAEKSKLLSIPFTFENREHFWAFANSDLAPEFLNEPPQEIGLPIVVSSMVRKVSGISSRPNLFPALRILLA